MFILRHHFVMRKRPTRQSKNGFSRKPSLSGSGTRACFLAWCGYFTPFGVRGAPRTCGSCRYFERGRTAARPLYIHFQFGAQREAVHPFVHTDIRNPPRRRTTGRRLHPHRPGGRRQGNQALSAILFLYRRVLDTELHSPADTVRPGRSSWRSFLITLLAEDGFPVIPMLLAPRCPQVSSFIYL